MLRSRLSVTLTIFCLASVMGTTSAAWGATEPAHETEIPVPAKPHVQLSVPEKKWVANELYTSAPGNYEVLIWGHGEVAKAMPENFDAEEEVREVAKHHIDWYTVGTPKFAAIAKYRQRFEALGLREAIGFPRSDTVEQ